MTIRRPTRQAPARGPRDHPPGLAATLLLALLAVAACGSEGPESGPGQRTVALLSPSGAEGAALIELRGPGIEAVTAVDGRVFHHARGDTVRVVVVRETPGELRFAVDLADTLTPPRGTVLEVADGENALRAVLADYSVEIRP